MRLVRKPAFMVHNMDSRAADNNTTTISFGINLCKHCTEVQDHGRIIDPGKYQYNRCGCAIGADALGQPEVVGDEELADKKKNTREYSPYECIFPLNGGIGQHFKNNGKYKSDHHEEQREIAHFYKPYVARTQERFYAPG